MVAAATAAIKKLFIRQLLWVDPPDPLDLARQRCVYCLCSGLTRRCFQRTRPSREPLRSSPGYSPSPLELPSTTCRSAAYRRCRRSGRGGFFINTYPQFSRCRTICFAAIEAVKRSLSWMRFRPLHRSAWLIDSAMSAGAAGVSFGSRSGMGRSCHEKVAASWITMMSRGSPSSALVEGTKPQSWG
jgi:hypothetical protein